MAHIYVKCSHCGNMEDFAKYRNISHPLVKVMRRERMCFDCACWRDMINRMGEDTIVVNGGLYRLSSPLVQLTDMRYRLSTQSFLVDPSRMEGYAASGMKLLGTIPPQFTKTLPDQYRFISRDDYKALVQFESDMCLSKGCFDRYHCLWYRADIAEPDEPWNTIPDDYCVGGENCPCFIDKKKIYGVY